MKAIRVDAANGFYSLPAAGQAEDWDEVTVGAAAITHREKLRGWGEYTDAYDVIDDGDDVSTYFVAMDLRAYRAPTGFECEYSSERAFFFRALPHGEEVALVVDHEHRLSLVLTDEASGSEESTPSLGSPPFASQKAIDRLGYLLLEAIHNGNEISPTQQLWLDRLQNACA